VSIGRTVSLLGDGKTHVDILAPNVDSLSIQQVARSLAHQCRFNGHTSRFYSVAEHSVYCAMLCDDDTLQVQHAALMHDAHESLTGDISGPMKAALGARCDLICQNAHDTFDLRFGCDMTAETRKQVKRADLVMLVLEGRALMGIEDPIKAWGLGPVKMPARRFRINCWTPDEAFAAFMQAYEYLTERLDSIG